MSLNKKTFLPALYLFLHSLVITVPIFAYASDSPEAVGTLTADRLWATTAAVLGLAGVIIGGLALARAGRPGGNGGGKRRSVVALVIALIATVNGALVLVTADGGPGTGNGIIGGVVAFALGLVGTALAWLALVRSRRTGRLGEEGGSVLKTTH